jgi:hypothetical protein
MLHACVQRFDVTGDRENILGWDREVNKAVVAQVNVWSSYVRTWNKDWICSTVVERLCYGHYNKLKGIGARSILQRYNNECPLCLSFFF